MPVNVGLAQLSDHFLLATVFFYAFAVLAYAGDFAFGRRRRRAHGRPGAGSARCREGQGRGGRRNRRPDRGHRAGDRGTARSPAVPGTRPMPWCRRPPPMAGWAGDGRAEPLARGRAARRAVDPGRARPDHDRPRHPDSRHRHPRDRRAPGPVGQHVRVRHGDHLRGGDRVPRPVVPVPRLRGRALPDGAHRARARAVRHRPVHRGRAPGPRAALLLDLDPRHRDDRGDRLLHRGGDLHRLVPGRGPACQEAGRPARTPGSARCSTGFPARTRWTGSPTGP